MKKNKIIILSASILIILAAFLIYIYKWPESKKDSIVVSNIKKTTDTSSSTVLTNTAVSTTIALDGKDAVGKYSEINGYFRDYSSNYSTGTIKVNWNKGAVKLTDSEKKAIWDKIDPKNEIRAKYLKIIKTDTICSGCEFYLYKAGTITAPANLKDKNVYYLYVPEMSLGVFLNKNYVFIDEARNKFISLSSSSYGNGMRVCNLTGADDDCVAETDIFGGYITVEFPELVAPKYINIPGQKLKLISNYDSEDVVSFDAGMYSKDTGQEIKLSSNISADKIEFTDAKYGPVYYTGSCYTIILPDGTQHNYDLLPSFLSADISEADKKMYPIGYTAKITWNHTNQGLYALGGKVNSRRCSAGIDSCSNVVDTVDWFSASNVVAIGKTNDGENVYELSDKTTNKYYKEVFDDSGYAYRSQDFNYQYDNTSTAYQKEFAAATVKMYTKYLADYPIFFWKDHKGRWRVYHKNFYIRMAECGKPVIYLYPQFTTDVKVKVEPNGGFTKTDPFYSNDGWFVRANPKSELFNYSDNKTYPYLFWEGKAYNYKIPDYGFVLAKSEVGSKMKIILAKLGLNEKETIDFLEFWQPRLEVKPYVFVTFIPQREFDLLAPLSVEPKPDSVIRVFMDYKPLNEKKSIREPIIKTPVRKGFAVVEWGGRLLK